jgi:hypothetical protein
MKKLGKFTVLALVVMALSSCGREKLTPIYQAVTINQLKNDQPINFSYQIDDTQIDEYAKNAGKFPLFGKLFQAIAVVLANTSISNSGGHDLELAPVDVDLSTLSAIDFDLIQFINFDSLMVSVRNAKSRDSLAFINTLEIHVKLDNPIEGLPVDANGYSKIVYYDSSKNSLECDGRCIKLNIAPVDWKKLLQTNKLVHLQPKLVINSVPLSSMKLAGSIDFSVKFNLGF